VLGLEGTGWDVGQAVRFLLSDQAIPERLRGDNSAVSGKPSAMRLLVPYYPEPRRTAALKSYVFKVVVEDDEQEDGRKAYHAYCPAFASPGAAIWGDTKEEALKNLPDRYAPQHDSPASPLHRRQSSTIRPYAGRRNEGSSPTFAFIADK